MCKATTATYSWIISKKLTGLDWFQSSPSACATMFTHCTNHPTQPTTPTTHQQPPPKNNQQPKNNHNPQKTPQPLGGLPRGVGTPPTPPPHHPPPPPPAPPLPTPRQRRPAGAGRPAIDAAGPVGPAGSLSLSHFLSFAIYRN